MKRVKEDWTFLYKQTNKLDIEKEIEEINTFSGNVARVLKECFKQGGHCF